MQAEGMFDNGEPAFGKAPEGFNSVDVTLSPDELVATVVDPEILVKTDAPSPSVAAPAEGVDDAFNIVLSLDDRLQRCLGGIGNFGVDTIAAVEQTKDDSLARSTSSTFAATPSSTEVKFIGLKLPSQWQAFDVPLAHAASDAPIDVVDRAHRYASEAARSVAVKTSAKWRIIWRNFALLFLEHREVSIFIITPRS